MDKTKYIKIAPEYGCEPIWISEDGRLYYYDDNRQNNRRLQHMQSAIKIKRVELILLHSLPYPLRRIRTDTNVKSPKKPHLSYD